jgi:hypothetical protein
MKIKLKDRTSASEEALRKLELELGFRLSESFKKFARQNDGAEPEINIFKVNDKTDGGVNRFIPISEICNERQWIENLPPKGYPVAWAEGGNYVFIDEGKGGEVYFWDHELPEEITKIGETFEVFLSTLEPFDVKSIKLKPGQVKRVWVDPEFLKSLKK